MTAQEIEYEVEADGRVTLEGLSYRRGQKLKLFLIADEEESTPPYTAEQIAANREAMRGTATRYTDPFEPACDPFEWDANRG